MRDATPEAALGEVVEHLRELRRQFALVGGLAVSIRSEVRFTRDLDLAILVRGDTDSEALVRALLGFGYSSVAQVEQEATGRLAAVRLTSSDGAAVDLVVAMCGIEPEIVTRATPVGFPEIGDIPVARPEELLAMKILSMTDDRPQDRMDARNLLAFNTTLDLNAVRDNLHRITERRCDRGQDLQRKLDALLANPAERSD